MLDDGSGASSSDEMMNEHSVFEQAADNASVIKPAAQGTWQVLWLRRNMLHYKKPSCGMFHLPEILLCACSR